MSSDSASPPVESRYAALFSTPLELGLRALVLLDAVAPEGIDLDRLITYDYLLVHSKDADGPESIHPALPHRSGELLVKRDILLEGLRILLMRELIAVHLSSTGIRYSATQYTCLFLQYLTGEYTDRLKESASWVIGQFGEWGDEELRGYVRERLSGWGGEFLSESLVRRVTI